MKRKEFLITAVLREPLSWERVYSVQVCWLPAAPKILKKVLHRRTTHGIYRARFAVPF